MSLYLPSVITNMFEALLSLSAQTILDQQGVIITYKD